MELDSNPLDRLSWRPPKVLELVDRRVVVNPRQARELLTAVTYIGERGGAFARGPRLMALYACMYFAGLRPAEAVALRCQDCYLPAHGWGRLTLEKSRPDRQLRSVGHLRCSPRRRDFLRCQRALRSWRHRGTPNPHAGRRVI